MKKIFVSVLLFSSLFAQNNSNQDEIEDRAYIGCAAYPSGHYKSCQTQNQSIYQQAACKAYGICG